LGWQVVLYGKKKNKKKKSSLNQRTP